MELPLRPGILCGLIVATAVTAPQAQNLRAVSVTVFPGGFSWPIWDAQEQGYFTKSGIEVKLSAMATL